MNKLATVFIIIIVVLFGSFVGGALSQPQVVTATKYLPTYDKPIYDNVCSNIRINSNTGEVTVSGMNKPVTVQIENRKDSLLKTNYVIKRVYSNTNKLKQELTAANKVITLLLKTKSCDLKYTIPEYFTSGREEEPDSVNHSQQ